MNRFFACFGLLLTFFLLCPDGYAKAPDRAGKMAEPSGLQPVFFRQADCNPIASAYGSKTRYDGSPRPRNRYGGRHGGIDLSLDEGTPLVAMADGEVVITGKGGRMEGNFMWIRHAPAQTGLSYWIYSKYQHLKAVLRLSAGDHVTAGQVVAHSGKTGTTGGHYGAGGYPHLHWSVMKSATGKFKIRNNAVLSKGAMLIDPLQVFRDARVDGVNNAPPGSKTVVIPFISEDNIIQPAGAQVVWPVFCR
jgi:murein DD-endopeptidase MepM/ murein hydrolase activator NlpD